MSDRSAAEIWIGGTLKRELVPEFCDVITRQRLALGWFGDAFKPETEQALLEARDDCEGVLLLHFCCEQACGGEFPELEEYLRKRELAYTRHASHCHYYDGWQINYRPGRELSAVMTNTDGEPVIGQIADVERAWYLVKEAQQLLQLGKPALALLTQAADLLASALPRELPRLPAFTISGNS